MPKMTRAAFLRGRLPGLKKLVGAGPGGGPFLGAAGNWGGCLAGGLDFGVVWPRMVSTEVAQWLLALGGAGHAWAGGSTKGVATTAACNCKGRLGA